MLRLNNTWGRFLSSLEIFCFVAVAVYLILVTDLLALVLVCCLMPQQALFLVCSQERERLKKKH